MLLKDSVSVGCRFLLAGLAHGSCVERRVRHIWWQRWDRSSKNAARPRDVGSGDGSG